MFKLDDIEKALKFLTSTSDDLVDKVYIRTSMLLIACAIIIGTKQTFGTPMECIADASFNDEWSAYVQSYCFVKGTFVLKGNMEEIPTVGQHSFEDLVYIGYYQWVPYILVSMAFVLYFPHLFWNVMQRFSDIDFNFFVDEFIKLRAADKAEDRKKISKRVVEQLFLVVQISKRRFVKEAGFISGSTGFLAYFASKVLSILIVVLQMCFLYYFIGRRDIFWGYNLTYNGLNSAHWNATSFFPRISFCTFRLNFLGWTQEHTVQCLLMMNMLNEKVFAMIYFWYLALIVITVANMFYIFCGTHKRIWTTNAMFDPHFLRDIFGLDGELLIYFIRNKTSHIYVSAMMSELCDLCAEQGYLEDRYDLHIAKKHKSPKTAIWKIRNDNLRSDNENNLCLSAAMEEKLYMM